MFLKKAELVDSLSRDLAHARNKRDSFAARITTLTAQIGLQTLPANLALDFNRNEIQRMLGNAVPSILAEVLAWEMRIQLLATRRKASRLKLMPAHRGAPPPPERLASVPAKYRSLIGYHAAHPGEGLGRSARRRSIAAA